MSLASKVKLMRFLVISIFMYTCESWTLTTELQKEHITNEVVGRKIPDFGQETETEVVRPHLMVFWLSKGNSTEHNERTKKTR